MIRLADQSVDDEKMSSAVLTDVLTPCHPLLNATLVVIVLAIDVLLALVPNPIIDLAVTP